MTSNARTGDRRIAAALVAVFAAYVCFWLWGHGALLFDPCVQHDDARTSIFPFHRYGPEGALAEDPIANEMLAFVPPAVRALYRALVPLTGLFAATKVVQGLAYAIIGLAGWIVFRSRRGGLAAGIVFVFLLLHSDVILRRGISGGLPKAFGYPAIALWIAGAIADRFGVRVAAAVVGGLAYPSSMLLVLGGEGFLRLREVVRRRGRAFTGAALRYAALVGVCFVLMIPYFFANADVGRIHTFDEARVDPAFGPEGRLRVLPFPNPVEEYVRFTVDPLLPAGRYPLPFLASVWPSGKLELIVPAVLFLMGGALVCSRRAPVPWPAVYLAGASVCLYALARMVAFRLYSPERFYRFAMPMVTIAFVTIVVGSIAHRMRPPGRRRARLAAAGVLVASMVLFFGDGARQVDDGGTIECTEDGDLYAFAASLPVTARFAAHPSDANDLPLWAARATTGGWETIQPWFTGSWRRGKERTEAALRALYATDRASLLAYCEERGITHLLIRDERYGPEFRERALLFEPFGAFVRDLLADVERDRLVVPRAPESAIVFRRPPWRVVDVERLRAEWERP